MIDRTVWPVRSPPSVPCCQSEMFQHSKVCFSSFVELQNILRVLHGGSNLFAESPHNVSESNWLEPQWELKVMIRSYLLFENST